MHTIMREVAFFIVLFLLLALGMHMEKWLSMPIEHFHNLSKHTLPLHPFIYTFVVYVGIMLLRGILALLARLFFGKKN